MNDRHVTVATFPDPSLAYVARGHLEAAGIPSFISNENIDPLFAGAGVWVKLEVAEDDSLRALAALDAAMPPDEEPPSESITTADDAVETNAPLTALSAEDEPEEAIRRHDAALDDDAGGDNERSRKAERVFRAAVVGLLFASGGSLFLPLLFVLLISVPLAAYATFALIEVWGLEGELTPRARTLLVLGIPAHLAFVGCLVFLFLLRTRIPL